MYIALQLLKPCGTHGVLVDLNEFSLIFWKVHHSHSRHQITNSNFLKIILKDRLWISNEWSLEGATCMCKTYLVKFSGASPKCVLFWKFLKILVSDKTIHKLFKFIKLKNKTNYFLDFYFFYFTIYQNYTLALSPLKTLLCWLKKTQKNPRILYDHSPSVFFSRNFEGLTKSYSDCLSKLNLQG